VHGSAERLGDGVAVIDATKNAVVVADAVADHESATVVVIDNVHDWDTVSEGEALIVVDAVVVADGEPVTNRVHDADTLVDAEADLLRDGEVLLVGVDSGDADALDDAVGDGLDDAVGLALEVDDGVLLLLLLPDGVAVGLAVVDALADGVAVELLDALADVLADTLGVAVGVAKALGEGVTLSDKVMVVEVDNVALADGDHVVDAPLDTEVVGMQETLLEAPAEGAIESLHKLDQTERCVAASQTPTTSQD